MNKESIYYNRMFGFKKLSYTLSTKTVRTCNSNKNKIVTYYYATFGNDTVEISKEEYDCLLEELHNL